VPVPDDEVTAASVVQEALGNSAIYLRRLKEDVLPFLPTKSMKKVFVELQLAQSRLYEDALHNLVIDVRQVDDSYFRKHLGKFMARKWALLQICSNPRAIDPLYNEVPAKLIALDQILKNILEDRGLKIVVWSFFRRSLDEIVKRYARYGVIKIDGSVDSIEERALAIHRFQNDTSVMVFVGNPAAAGAGITLTAASHAVYESFSNQAAHYLQSVDRIHRRGQQSPVTSFVLIARSTIEQREFEKLTLKERRGHELFGKQPTEPVTREGFLKDLLGD
jgi:SNF2 family DNA or RNA helicase